MSRGREQQSVLPLHSEESTGTFIPGYSVTEQVRTVNVGPPDIRNRGAAEEAFLERERSRRAFCSELGHIRKEKPFFSHCWRLDDTQEKKHRIIDHLSSHDVGLTSNNNAAMLFPHTSHRVPLVVILHTHSRLAATYDFHHYPLIAEHPLLKYPVPRPLATL